MFYLPFFFQGVVEGVVIEVANVDVRHPQQGRLKFLLSCHLYIKKSSVLKFSLQFCQFILPRLYNMLYEWQFLFFSVPLEGSGKYGYSHRHKSIKLIYIIIVIQHSSFIAFVLISTNLVFLHNFVRFKSFEKFFCFFVSSHCHYLKYRKKQSNLIRKQRILGIFIHFNLALGLFRKEGNVLVGISMSPIIIISSSFADILQKKFLKFFSFVFLFIFPLFAVLSNKTNFASNLFGVPR